MGKIWLVDNEPSKKYPIYTRGNVGEVFPEAVAPLTWTWGAVKVAEPAWRDAFARFGVFDHDEYDPDNIEILGCFGGYAYLNVSLSRVLAVRTPGLTPELMDQAFFGESDAPPYQPLPTDESPAHTDRIMATLGWVLTTDGLPELLEDQRQVDEVVTARPDLSSLTDAELVAKSREHIQGLFRHLYEQHIFITYCSTVPVGIIQAVCAEAGDPTLALRLISAIGDVDSAAPSWAMWELGREARQVAQVGKAFDQGVAGLLDRLAAIPEASAFLKGFEDLLDRFGSRGPNEWETRSQTWGTNPELALAAIDRMRHAPDSAAPQGHWEERSAEREALTAQIGEALKDLPEVQGQFLAAVRAAGIFLSGRERSKTNVIKLLHEARLCLHQLGQRMVAAGHFDCVEDYGMLMDDELDQLLVDPGQFTEVIRERNALYGKLQGLEPPFIINGTVPPLEEWKPRGSTPVEVASSGTVLSGIPGAPGTHTGRARVVLRPDDPRDLEPGDVLVAPITDPAWTPLFVPAGAVVVDVGAQASHAVIVARELCIPCVVSVTDATRRIPDGAMVTVDGSTGTVTLA